MTTIKVYRSAVETAIVTGEWFSTARTENSGSYGPIPISRYVCNVFSENVGKEWHRRTSLARQSHGWTKCKSVVCTPSLAVSGCVHHFDASAPRQGAVKEHLIVTPADSRRTLGFMTPAGVYPGNMPRGPRLERDCSFWRNLHQPADPSKI
ncbi:hypothetical protein Bbelb_022820 [Branchiostoma belcheri]|nr:hypothetical protein Bbelb_022820 [Branchiostoma belcheri]